MEKASSKIFTSSSPPGNSPPTEAGLSALWRRRLSGYLRSPFILLAMVLMALSLWLADRAQVPLSPEQEPGLLERRETNSFLRLAQISDPFVSLRRINSNVLCAVSQGSIYLSQDNGRLWDRADVSVQAERSVRINAVAQVGERLWAVGDSGLILSSVDGCRTWSDERGAATTPASVSGSLFFIPAAHAEDPAVLKKELTNKGADIPAPPAAPSGFSIVEPDNADKPGNDVSKAPASAPENIPLEPVVVEARLADLTVAEALRQDFKAVDFSSATDGWIVGTNGVVLKTIDGGQTWSHPRTTLTRSIGRSVQQSGGDLQMAAAATLEQLGETLIGVDASGGDTLRVWSNDLAYLGTAEGSRWQPVDLPTPLQEQKVWFSLGPRLWLAEEGLLSVLNESARTRNRDAAPGWETLFQFESPLKALRFAGSGRGWALTEDNNVFSSTDFGQSWKPVSPGFVFSGERIELTDSAEVWLLGEQNRLLRSRDNGASWQLQHHAGGFEQLASTDNGRGWLLMSPDLLFSTADQGQSWTRVSLPEPNFPAPAALLSLAAAGNQVWLGSDAGEVTVSPDGGNNWRTDWAAPSRRLNALLVTGPDEVWAGGDDALLIRTTNGGASWVDVPTGDFFDTLVLLREDPDGRLWALSEQGGLLRGAPDGSPWLSTRGPLSLYTEVVENSVRVTDLNFSQGRAWATLSDGRLVSRTSDRGTGSLDLGTGSLDLRNSSSEPGNVDWLPVLNTSLEPGFQEGAGGQVVNASLNAVFPGATGNLWVAGNSGQLLYRSEPEGRWEQQNAETAHDLNALGKLDSRLWLMGESGVLRFSDDLGSRWQQPAYEQHPPVLCYLLGVIALGCLLLHPRYRARQQRVAEAALTPTDDITSLAVNDKAVQSVEEDRLGYARLARAIARFLHNRNTRPPLTLAVTGRWGTGKSSIMRMLKQELALRGYPVVWFNAWHHHTENTFLGALLETIRNEGLPRPTSLRGLWIRLRLLWRRYARKFVVWMILLAGLLLLVHTQFYPLNLLRYDTRFAGDLSLLYKRSQSDVPFLVSGNLIERLQTDEARELVWPYRDQYLCRLSEDLKASAAQSLEESEPASLRRCFANATAIKARIDASLDRLDDDWRRQWIDLWTRFKPPKEGLIPLILALVLALVKYSGIFSSLTGNWWQSIRSKLDTITLEMDPGLRYRIGQTLEDLSWALGNKPLVLFIDDVDRCPSGQQLKILETINFLSEGGRKGYFVLGTALDIVIPSIAREFASPVQEKIERREGEEEGAYERRLWHARKQYAEHYMEKMIGLEIKVPQASPEQIEGLIGSSPQPAPDGRSATERQDRRMRYLQALRNLLDRVTIPLLALTLIVFCGYRLSMDWGEQDQLAIPLSDIPALSQQADEGESGDSDPGTADIPVAEAVLVAPPEAASRPDGSAQNRDARYVPLTVTDTLWSVWLVAGIVAAAILLLLFMYVDYQEREDTPDFRKAIAAWSELLNFWDSNPRQFKRVMNQLRLLTLRARLLQESRDTTVAFITLRALFMLMIPRAEVWNTSLPSGVHAGTIAGEVKSLLDGELSPQQWLSRYWHCKTAGQDNQDEDTETDTGERSFSGRHFGEAETVLVHCLEKYRQHFAGQSAESLPAPDQDDVRLFLTLIQDLRLL